MKNREKMASMMEEEYPELEEKDKAILGKIRRKEKKRGKP